MTLHSQSRRQLHWDSPAENHIYLSAMTEFSTDEIKSIATGKQTEQGVIDTVLRESDRNFIRSLDAERQKTIVVHKINGTRLQ